MVGRVRDNGGVDRQFAAPSPKRIDKIAFAGVLTHQSGLAK